MFHLMIYFVNGEVIIEITKLEIIIFARTNLKTEKYLKTFLKFFKLLKSYVSL